MSDFELGPRLKGIKLTGTDCINWPGATRNGYGVKKIGDTTVPAHKYVYEQSTGKKVPKGWQVDHVCRNRLCINPKHLEAISPSGNTERAWAFKLGKYKHKYYKGESKDGKLMLVKPKDSKTPVEAVKVEKGFNRKWTTESTPNTRDVYRDRIIRKTPKHIGTLETTPQGNNDRIKWIKVRRGYRGKGIAQRMIQDQQKQTGRKIVHSDDLTRLGRKFAKPRQSG